MPSHSLHSQSNKPGAGCVQFGSMENDPRPVLALIRGSAAGDEGAFAALFEQYKNLVFKTALLLLDGAGAAAPEAEAEEALQEVFLNVYRSLASYQPERAAFSTWLYRITVNHCLNRRRGRRWPWLSLEQLPAGTGATPSPEHALSETDEVRGALRRLSGKLRATVVLRFYADLSYAEIAQVLDIPIGTVKSRLAEALKLLGRDLGPTTAPARGGLKLAPEQVNG
jgi:RNA polymerase sigma-70 factor, ECF subfamily